MASRASAVWEPSIGAPGDAIAARRRHRVRPPHLLEQHPLALFQPHQNQGALVRAPMALGTIIVYAVRPNQVRRAVDRLAQRGAKLRGAWFGFGERSLGRIDKYQPSIE